MNTIQQAAKELGLHPKTLRRWEESGKFIPQRTMGNQRRYSPADITKLKAIKSGESLPEKPLDKILTLDEAAAKLHVSTATLRRWTKQGKLKIKVNDALEPGYSLNEINQVLGKQKILPPEPIVPLPVRVPPVAPKHWYQYKYFPHFTAAGAALAFAIAIYLVLTSPDKIASPSVEQLDLNQGVEFVMPRTASFLDGGITIGLDSGSLSFLDEKGNIYAKGAALIEDSVHTSSLQLLPSDQPENQIGRQYVDSSTGDLMYFDGNAWISLNQTAGSGGTSLQDIYDTGNTTLTGESQDIDITLGNPVASSSATSLSLTLAGNLSTFKVLGGASQEIISFDDDAIFPVTISQPTQIKGNLYASQLVDNDNANYYLDPGNTGLALNIAGSATISGTLKFATNGEYLHNGTNDYLIFSAGLGVGGGTTYGLNGSGDLNVRKATFNDTATFNGEFRGNGQLYLGDGGDALTINSPTITVTDFYSCTALETNGSGVLTCGSDDTGGTGDADTLDTLDSTAFLRSNTSDSFTSGTLTFNPGTTLAVNGTLTSADLTVDNLSLNGNVFSSTTGDIDVTPVSASNLDIDVAGGGEIQLDGGLVDIGTGTYVLANGDNDLGIAGDLEVLGNLRIDGTTTLNTVAYTWPGADGAVNYILSTNGSGTLSWVDPAGAAASAIAWVEGAGILYPKNSTVDLLVGGQATTSAKFAVLNVNDGTPTASVSGNSGNIATFLTGLGNLSTTNSQTLTLGGTNTGNILFQPNGDTTDYLQLTSDGTDLTLATTDSSHLTINPAGNLVLSGALVDINASANLDIDVTGTVDILGSSTFSIDGTGASNVSATSGNLTVSTVTSGNLILTTAGSLVLTGFNTCTALETDGSGVLSCGSDDGGASFAYWRLASGALSPVNDTLDLLIGSNATASAKFAFINVNDGTPTASVSGNSGNIATFLTGLGNLSTTNGQTLTLGGTNTGNILFQPNGDTTDYLQLTSDGTDLTLSTTDLANLTIDPNSSADIYFHGTTYNLSDTGDLTLGGRITFENAGFIHNETDGILVINEPTLQFDASTALDINSPILDLSTQTVDVTLNSAADALNFDSDTLSIDAASNKIGIGNAAPDAKLQVTGKVTGKALAIFDETGDQDIIAASASGSTRFRVATDGHVYAQRYVDTADTSYYIDPAASGTSIMVSGDIISDGAFSITSNATGGNITLNAGAGTVVIGDGTGKLDAGTVDPPYTINGLKYATYMSGMTGVKEETTGIVETNYGPFGYSTTIDFKTLPLGSDLWLFAQTADIKKHLTDMVVLLSPAGNARTWYTIDSQQYLLTIYSSQPTQVSYRLTAPRFDADSWQNTRDSGSTGFVINTDKLQENINGVIIGLQNGMEEIFETIRARNKIIAPTVETATLVTDFISPLSDDRTITIAAKTIIEGELEVATIAAETISAEDITTDTLTAREINSSTIDNIREKIAALAENYASQTATAGANLEGSELLASLEPIDASQSANLSLETINATAGFFSEYLAVLGSATITDLGVSNTLNVSQNLVFTANSITALDNQLFFQPTGEGSINFLAGLLTLDGSGQVQINGNLTVTGTLIASQISAPEFEDLAISIASGSAVSIYNAIGENVSQIDASGSGSFATLNLKASGSEQIVAGENHVIIASPDISANSQIIVTFTANYSPATKYWVTKDPANGQFTIFVNYPVNSDTTVDWLVIN